jgi:hypothetical protein
MFLDKNIAHNHRTSFADGFDKNAMNTLHVDEFGSVERELVYTISEQNDDDLFLSIPNSSLKRNSQHLQQFKEHWQLIVGKLTLRCK